MGRQYSKDSQWFISSLSANNETCMFDKILEDRLISCSFIEDDKELQHMLFYCRRMLPS